MLDLGRNLGTNMSYAGSQSVKINCAKIHIFTALDRSSALVVRKLWPENNKNTLAVRVRYIRTLKSA